MSPRGALIGLHIIGAVPPIQFVKDMTTARLQEVERLLEKADMGPDFEPTPLGGSMRTEPRLDYHRLSIQSRLTSLTERFGEQTLDDFGMTREGPSGSVEVMGKGYAQAEGRQQLSDVHPDDFGQASTDFHEHIRKSDVSDYSARTQPTSDESVRGDATNESINMTLRDDLYDVPHAKLTLQVLNAKRKSRDRSFDMSTDTNDPNDLEKLFSNSDLEKLLSSKRRQQKGVIRAREITCSSTDMDDSENFSKDADKYEDVYEFDEEEDFIDDDDFDSYGGRK